MGKLVWDKTSERLFETGVRNAVLYPYDKDTKTYGTGVAWNGVVAINENPSGAEATALYADDIKYLDLLSAEDCGATIEAYTYPDEFAECDGSAKLGDLDGVYIGQQPRKTFGLCYRTILGNDTEGENYSYKLHILYGCKASPSEKTHNTVNDNPEASTFSWSVSTTPEEIGTINGIKYKPSACITIDASKFTTEALKAKLETLEDLLYGTDPAGSDTVGSAATLPSAKTIYETLAA